MYPVVGYYQTTSTEYLADVLHLYLEVHAVNYGCMDQESLLNEIRHRGKVVYLPNYFL